jgi:DNA-directed RNA polymerase subunit E'/Rpb7
MTETKINNPYINTYLNTTVRILPSQMDNNIRKHIKNNLEKEHINKCFLDYGYVSKIVEIVPNYDAEIVAEDPLSCALFQVKFLCELCRPLLNSTIICRTGGVTPPIILLVNGPLDIIIKTSQNINKNVFVFNQKLNTWTAKKESAEQNKYIVVKEGMLMKVKIINKKIINKSERILCIGYLENIATEEEIRQNEESLNKIKDKYQNIQDYLNIENKIAKEEEEKLLKNTKLEISDLTEESDK